MDRDVFERPNRYKGRTYLICVDELSSGNKRLMASVGNKWGASYSKQAAAQWLTIGKRPCGLVRANSLFSLSICCHSRQRRSIKQIFAETHIKYLTTAAPAQILGHSSQTVWGVSRTHCPSGESKST